MKSYYKKIAVIALLILVIGCSKNNCPSLQGAKLDFMQPIAKEKGYDYCATLTQALLINEQAIQQFSLFAFSDSISYSHGQNLIALIDTVGEQHYVAAIKSLDEKQKTRIKYYISSVLRFGYQGDKTEHRIKDIYPLLSENL